jgi:predicted nucleic acid-binding protein
MRAFPDTTFLCAVYRTQPISDRADAFMATRTESLGVSSLLLLEFRQSLRFQARLHEQKRGKGFPRTETQLMLRYLESDLATNVLQTVAVDWSDVHQRAEALSARYTEGGGHRLADILHVATALHLGAEEFLTFEANQKKLAVAEGMKVRV